MTDRWHTLPAHEVLSILGTDPVTGLTSEEAGRRLGESGPNALAEHAVTPAWLKFARQFNDFMIYVLMAAAAVAMLQGDSVEAAAILAIVLVNGVLGFVQEARAERALASLKELSAPTASVVREGTEVSRSARDIVPGDLIVLQAGDAIPADARLVEAAALRLEESSLTGESVPVHKSAGPLEDAGAPLGDRSNLVYAGTHVVAGHGRAVVVATGMATEVGKIASLLEAPEERTPLQRELGTVGQRIALGCLAVCVAVFGVGLTRGNPPEEMFLIAVSLAVAAIPEGLPAVVTVALSIAVQRMAARNAIVRRLHSVETLGSTDTICTDKTGTLTVNDMTVTSVASVDHVWPGDLAAQVTDSEMRWLKLVARNCNDARTSGGVYIGDPTEVALLRFSEGAEEGERLDEIPFDAERKRMTTVTRLRGGDTFALVKGAPDFLLARSSSYLSGSATMPLDEAARDKLMREMEDLAAVGRRTLGAAYRRVEGLLPDDLEGLETSLVFVGIFAMADPPRPEVPEAIALCRSAGIRVAMVTGDHRLTAEAIGSEIGLLPARASGAETAHSAAVIDGRELDALSDEALASQIEDIFIYARVSPSHKLRIVEALRARGHIVAMTGDGVNDAPALKRADIGVAMGQVGTDVTREAADMVLADDNFASIVCAVREGRAVFDNIRKVILYLLSCNVSEVLIVFVSMFFIPLGQPALLPLQILWINLVTDGFPALALGVDPPAGDLMRRPPRSRASGILVRRNQIRILVQGGVITVGGLAALAWELGGGASVPQARAVLFTTMVLTQLLHSFTFRSDRESVLSPSTLENRWLVAALGGSMLLQAALVYSPLYAPRIASAFLGTAGVATPVMGVAQWTTVLVCALGAVGIIDATKRWLVERS